MPAIHQTMQLFTFLTAVFAVKAYGAVVPQKLDSEVCLCLGEFVEIYIVLFSAYRFFLSH